MGAFFISPQMFDNSKVISLFKKQGFRDPVEFTVNGRRILLYKKQLIDNINFIKINDDIIFSTGACFYKGYDQSDCLKSIYNDFEKGGLNSVDFQGSFFTYISYRGLDYYFTDQAGIQNVFFHQDASIISSSFLATLIAVGELAGKQRINKMALKEVLITGNLIGPDTIIDGINRYEPVIHQDLLGMKKIQLEDRYIADTTNQPGSWDEVDNQIQRLHSYFISLKTVIDRYGANLGLTGGLDSRLLYLLIRKHTNNYQVYSNYRGKPGAEFLRAQELTDAAGDTLLPMKFPRSHEIDSQTLLQLVRDNLYFNDGLIRTHQLWTELNKSREHLQKLYSSHLIGLSGVGGEQYRNGEFLLKNRYLFKNWILNELVIKNIGKPFHNGERMREFTDYLRDKISSLLAIDANSKYISRHDIKRYYNEIWNPANRTIRNNIENQLVFFLSPFTDYEISNYSYRSIDYHGTGPLFEMEMIKRIEPTLANCNTDYGFPINGPIGFKYKLVPHVKNVIGLSMYNRLYYWKKRSSANVFDALVSNNSKLKNMADIVNEVDTDINIEHVKKSDYLSPLLIEAGVFFQEMNSYVRND